MQHTPGLWKVYKDIQEPRYVDEFNAYDIYTFNNKQGLWLLGSVNKLRDEYKANARLISAAPDLLFQLQRMVTYYDSDETRAEAVAKIKDARLAISKTGIKEG